MSSSELVSVVVPVYNSARYLTDSLYSVAGQTYRYLDIVVVDDGTTDGSAEICDEFAAMDNRFTVIHQENKGPSEARNVGLSHCHGEWICFLDSDDVMLPNMIERLHDVASQGYKLAMCSYSTVSDRDEIKGAALSVAHATVFNEYSVDRCLDEFVTGWPNEAFNTRFKHGVLWNKMYHSSLLKGINFNVSLKRHVDQPFCMEALIRTDKVAVIQEKLYLYYIRSGSVSHPVMTDLRSDYLRSSLFMFEILRSYRENDWRPFLRQLYRYILIMNNDTRNMPGKAESRAALYSLIDRTKQDYITSSCIPLFERLGFFMMWAFPPLFSLLLKVWLKVNDKDSRDSRDI